MLEISFNLDKLLHELEAIESGLQGAVDAAMQECGELVVAEESRRTKGSLAKSFYTYKSGDSQIIDNTKEYAQYVEYGRGPVYAVNAKALRFVINGEVLFRKSVGPMKAQPFVKDSLNSASGKFNHVFDKHLNKLIG